MVSGLMLVITSVHGDILDQMRIFLATDGGKSE